MRMSNTNNFSASFNVATPYQMVVIHSSKLIYPRELYQRGIQRKRVELIARDFNEYTANEPKISFRNGRYYVTDGQHSAYPAQRWQRPPDSLQGVYGSDDAAGSPVLRRAERSRCTADGGHQAPCQGRGRGCSFHGIPRSHQPGGSGLQL